MYHLKIQQNCYIIHFNIQNNYKNKTNYISTLIQNFNK